MSKLPFDEKYLSHCILEGLNDNTRSEIIKHIGSYPDLEKLKKKLKFLQQTKNNQFKHQIIQTKDPKDDLKKTNLKCYACNGLVIMQLNVRKRH